jgi:hypothetical protein
VTVTDEPVVEPFAAGDPVPPTAQPLILTDCYVEIGGVNLRCLAKHLEACAVDVKKNTIETFCSRTDYPGTVKYTLKVDFYQSFDSGATFDTLNAAVTGYKATSTPVAFKARPYASRVASATNPIISGLVIPTDFVWLSGDAGAPSEVSIEWDLTGPPSRDTGAVTATGAVAGAPGYFTPTGATQPANLAALTGVTASPATNWATGQYVITADYLANNWNGTTWVAGKHP